MLMLVIILALPCYSLAAFLTNIPTSSSWIPSSTSPATALVTASSSPPTLNALRPRDRVDTCGFVSGDIASPMTCSAGYTCSSVGLVMDIMACCNKVTCTDDPRTCIPHLGTDCPDTSECSEIYTSVLYCSQAAPACVTYQRITSVGDPNSLVCYACGNASTQIVALVTPTNALATPTSIDGGGISAPFSSASPSISTPSSDGGGGNDGGVPSENNKIIRIAPFAVVPLAALGIWYMWKRWRTARARYDLHRQKQQWHHRSQQWLQVTVIRP